MKSSYKRNYSLKSKYGISLQEYNELLHRQDGKCAICYTSIPGRGRKNLLVDHNHKTGQIRGLLCHNCNNGIGFLRLDDGIDLLNKAIYYLSNTDAL